MIFAASTFDFAEKCTNNYSWTQRCSRLALARLTYATAGPARASSTVNGCARSTEAVLRTPGSCARYTYAFGHPDARSDLRATRFGKATDPVLFGCLSHNIPWHSKRY